MSYSLPATVKQILESKELDVPVSICAWVRSKRSSKNTSFLNLNDGSCVQGIQAVITEEANLSETLELCDNGAAVRVQGLLIASQGKKQSVEISVSALELIGPALDYPLQKKRHTFEFLREISHLRSRSNSIGAVMRVRSKLSMLVHEFFQEHSFTYVHTPIITLSDAEGAGEMFCVQHSSPAAERGKHFFSQEAFLTVSGQLEGEAYAHSHSRIYTFGPTFRAEDSNTARHLAEFWMIEPEVAFMQLPALMQLAEAFVRYLISGILRTCPEELELFQQWIEPGLTDSLQAVAQSKQFQQITYADAVALLKDAANKGKHFDFAIEQGLQTEHERWLTEEYFQQPVIVYDYPAADKAFYMKRNGDVVRAMDILVPRLGEIIGGSEREDDYNSLYARMQEAGMELEHYQWYLDLRRFGSTPHSGFGLGFERMVQYVTGMKNIRDVIPFPRVPGRAY